MTRIAHLILAGFLLASPAVAEAQSGPTQFYGEGDLKLESGEAIRDFSIGYVTYGTLNAKNLTALTPMVTALMGNHHRLDFMIGPCKALDPDKYFIICTDAIANGVTTSPSNSKLQPRMQFPKFVLRDMVESQYRLLEEHSGCRSRPRNRRALDGGHADAAMGRQPSRLHGRAGRHRAARQDAALERRGDGGGEPRDHERSGVEGGRARRL